MWTGRPCLISLPACLLSIFTHKSIWHPRDLARQFDQITSSEHIQNLDDVLNRYFGELAKTENRSVVRRNRPVRLLIRFFAKALAEHLSYWLQEEIFSYDDPFSGSQGASLHYFDVYVAFAILEERINENLYPCEGILIVKERTRENQETTMRAS
jgi:hypothetical protein